MRRAVRRLLVDGGVRAARRPVTFSAMSRYGTTSTPAARISPALTGADLDALDIAVIDVDVPVQRLNRRTDTWSSPSMACRPPRHRAQSDASPPAARRPQRGGALSPRVRAPLEEFVRAHVPAVDVDSVSALRPFAVVARLLEFPAPTGSHQGVTVLGHVLFGLSVPGTVTTERRCDAPHQVRAGAWRHLRAERRWPRQRVRRRQCACRIGRPVPAARHTMRHSGRGESAYIRPKVSRFPEPACRFNLMASSRTTS